MAGEEVKGRRSAQAVAVILVLCCLAQSLTCFSFQGLNKDLKQDKVVSEATVMEVRTGGVIFNGKELDSQSRSASAAATGNNGLLNIDLDQSDGRGILEQMSQLEDAMANEAAWRRLNPSVQCGQTKMKLKAMGPGAADLQLDMGNARPLPLIQVPETCHYSMKQNALGLILVVPYDGCNVIQENGNYVLPMSWLGTPVKFACPMLTSSATTPASTTPQPAQQPWKLPLPHGLSSLNRQKRQTIRPLSTNDPHYTALRQLYNLYQMYLTRGTPAPNINTTTAKPNMTTNSTRKPPAYPYSPYSPYYSYYYYYLYYFYYSYYLSARVPVQTTKPPAATTTAPASTTTAPASTTTAPASTTTAPAPTTTDCESTTTASASTTTAIPPMKHPYFPYFPYHYHPQAGQQLPGFPNNPIYYHPQAGQQLPGFPNNPIYYHPLIQHYYGKPPYPQTPTLTAPKPVDTAPKPVDTAPKPVDTAPTEPTESSPDMKPSSQYPGPFSPYDSFYDRPFDPYVLFKNKAAKLPDYLKYMPQAGYKSGLQPQAHPPPHAGFHYWQPGPLFPHSTGKDNSQLDGKNLQPKHVLTPEGAGVL